MNIFGYTIVKTQTLKTQEYDIGCNFYRICCFLGPARTRINRLLALAHADNHLDGRRVRDTVVIEYNDLLAMQRDLRCIYKSIPKEIRDEREKDRVV